MANTNSPFGFRQYSGTGSAPTYEQNVRLIKSDNTTAIFFGDAVIPLTTGYIGQATASTVRVEGIFAGCKYVSTSQKRTVWSNYWPGSDANGDVEAYIIDDPNAKFLVQSSDSGGTAAITFANIGEYINLAVGTGNTATGISGMTVNVATLATTVTLPFRIVGLVTSPPGAEGTDTATEYNQVIVAFNNASTRTNGAGPVGIA
tara:strand:+ start:927 stop:1535 length:609 start_codon:yes stop_codon:yes gene_type:complete